MRPTRLLLDFTILVAAATPAPAQTYAIDRGVWLLSASASLNHLSDGGGTNFGIGGTVGYFVAPRFALKAALQLSHASSHGSSSTAYGVGPGVAYYFGRPASQIHPYLSFSSLYTHQANRDFLTWTGSGGLALMMVRNVAAIGEAYFTQARSQVPRIDVNTGMIVKSTSTTEQYGIRFGLAIFLY
jgi:hypothetical protein